MARAVLPTTGVLPMSGYGTALAWDGRWLVAGAPEWDYRPQDASRGDIVGTGRVFVYDLDTLDADGDTMPDTWEQQFGLDPTTRTMRRWTRTATASPTRRSMPRSRIRGTIPRSRGTSPRARPPTSSRPVSRSRTLATQMRRSAPVPEGDW